jgi:hypothetical protein
MIEDAVKIVKNHYALGEILSANELRGGFVNLTLSSQSAQEWGSVYMNPLRFAHNGRSNNRAAKNDMI